jgi:anthranilate synthase component 1
MHFGVAALQEVLPRLSKDHIILKQLTIDKPPFEVFKRLESSSERCYIFESASGPRRLSEYTFIGSNPVGTLTISQNCMQAESYIHDDKQTIKTEDPMPLIHDWLAESSGVNFPFRLVAGGVGFVSYEASRFWESSVGITRNYDGFPDIMLDIYADGIIFDHRRKEYFYYSWLEDRSRLIEETADKSCELRDMSASEPRLNITQSRFEKMVQKTKDYIYAGDILQAVLSKRYGFNLEGEPIPFYERLRLNNPSPYMYYLKMGDIRIVGSSPEMLVRVQGSNVETYPIAGTRPVTGRANEDRRLAREMLSDPKELAEHTMLVDLARNDLGRICAADSVKVPEFMSVKRFSRVQHLVSRVTGVLEGNQRKRDVLRAVFPAGTVSGAPKIRAMQIIDELEASARGPYAGAVGYLSFTGDMDFAITIRTLVAKSNRASIQAGAGIVADSIPEREWLESEAKAAALIEALEGGRR